jgi:hypothetical protein
LAKAGAGQISVVIHVPQSGQITPEVGVRGLLAWLDPANRPIAGCGRHEILWEQIGIVQWVETQRSKRWRTTASIGPLTQEDCGIGGIDSSGLRHHVHHGLNRGRRRRSGIGRLG